MATKGEDNSAAAGGGESTPVALVDSSQATVASSSVGSESGGDEAAGGGGGGDNPETQETEGGDVAVEGAGGEEEVRDTWGSKLGYVLTLVGYAVGFGNIWRFPFLLHSNGGVAFLIPYCTMLAFAGIPLFFLELAIGQRLRKGALGCWNEISPFLGGLGIASGLTCFFVELYYNTLVAWVVLYLIDSCRSKLAWTNCEDLKPIPGEKTWDLPGTGRKHKKVPQECARTNEVTKYYFYRRMLDVSDDITHSGNFNPWMLMAITISWLMVLAILIKGIKSSEKVVYFTALFPYVVLLIFFCGNFTRDGWKEGYEILFKPDFSKLGDAQVWLKAGSQIFFSLGVAFGCLIVFASYLPPNNNCYKDAVNVSLINCGTSLLASIVLFPVFGILGKKRYDECTDSRTIEALLAIGKTTADKLFSPNEKTSLLKHYTTQSLHSKPGYFEKGWVLKVLEKKSKTVVNEVPIFFEDKEKLLDCDLEKFVRASGAGTGLVFIAFAEAVLKLPCPTFWSILFFLMLFTLGIDSSFGTLEGAIAPLMDLKIIKLPRWAITSIVTGVLFLVSLVFCWGWGMYVEVFLDQFVANWGLLLIAFFETVGIAWIYGLAKFAYDIKLMTGSRPNLFIMMCWRYITPFLILGILFASFIQEMIGGYKYNVYDKSVGELVEKSEPQGIIAFGFILWLAIIIWVPLQAILKLFGKSLLKQEVPNFFPEEDLRQERNMGDDEEEFNRLDQLVMGKSIEDFQKDRVQERVKRSPSIATDRPSIQGQGSTAGGSPGASNQDISSAAGTTTPSKGKDASKLPRQSEEDVWSLMMGKK